MQPILVSDSHDEEERIATAESLHALATSGVLAAPQLERLATKLLLRVVNRAKTGSVLDIVTDTLVEVLPLLSEKVIRNKASTHTHTR